MPGGEDLRWLMVQRPSHSRFRRGCIPPRRS